MWLPKIASGLAQLPRWATLIVGMIDLLKRLGGLLVGVFRSHAAREAEMAFLRQQLVVLRRSAPPRLRLRSADRVIFVWLYRLFPSVLEAAVVFKPATLVRWHRSGFRLYWRCKSRRRVGRPAVPADIRDLIRIISRDNPLWGAPRIHGELLKLGIDIAQSTVAKYMSRRHGPRSPGLQLQLIVSLIISNSIPRVFAFRPQDRRRDGRAVSRRAARVAPFPLGGSEAKNEGQCCT